MTNSNAIAITAYTATSALGNGLASSLRAIESGLSGLTSCDFLDTRLSTWIGRVDGLESIPLDPHLAAFECRNNRLANIGLKQDGFAQSVATAIERYGPDRVAVYVGSSTSGLLNTELAYQNRCNDTGALPSTLRYEQTHNMGSLAAFVSSVLGTQGPRYVVSIACASSAKVFASAARAIRSGIVDAAVVGGVDTLCLTTLYGFDSLELLSPDICEPFGAQRRGISIGEAAAFALLEKPEPANAGAPRLVGYGESSDAFHMSAPHPDGLGAQRAILAALERADCKTTQIDYINLHGTATPSNDKAEDAAVYAVFGTDVPASSTKGLHGHTLGAAGALEAIVSLIAIENNFLPGGATIDHKDPNLRCHYVTKNQAAPVRRVISNSFGFGGANAALIFEQGD